MHRAFRGVIIVSLVLVTGCETSPDRFDKGGGTVRQILFKAAAASQGRNDYDAAIASYRSLYDRDPEDIDVVLGLARNLRYVGSLEDAAAVLDRALVERSDDSRLLVERGKIEIAGGRSERAIEILDRAKQNESRKWQTFSALGVAHDFLGRHEVAQGHYRHALKLEPKNPHVLNNLALSLALSGRLERAIGILAELTSRPNASVQARQNLALLFALKGDYGRSESLARRGLPEEFIDGNLNYFRALSTDSVSVNVTGAIKPTAVPPAQSDPFPTAQPEEAPALLLPFPAPRPETAPALLLY